MILGGENRGVFGWFESAARSRTRFEGVLELVRYEDSRIKRRCEETYRALANRRLQPLGHLSGGWFSTV